MQAEKNTMPKGRPETVGLITVSHRGDLERCALLFESIDRHVPERGMHTIIVDDDDVPLFARFRRKNREVRAKSAFLPRWLRLVPALTWRGRRYWWSLHGKPISGWHVQQIVKIEAARSLPQERFCMIDSDVVFFRDFDLGALAPPNPAPLHVHEGSVTLEREHHRQWLATASRLTDMPERRLPADDYIDQIIVWDRESVRAMIARIETVTGRNWIAAMCRDRYFSEYMIYGTFVANTPSALARHTPTGRSFTRTHWEASALGTADILAMLDSADDWERAFCIQSFGSTPVATIRASLDMFYSRPANAMKGPPTRAA